MFVPSSGRGPPEPLSPDFSPPGLRASDLLELARGRLLSAADTPAGPLGGDDPFGGDGPLSPPGPDDRGERAARPEDERGPDQLGDMPGGAEAMLRVRRARRRELLKEGANVAAGSVVAALVAGMVLLESGVGPAGSLVTAASVAGGWGWILGREVVADLARNTEFLERDRDVW